MVAEKRRGEPKEDPQAGMFDHVIEDEDFEAAVREWHSLEKQRERLSALRRRMREGAERNDVKSLDDGARVRLGAYTFDVKARSGGGFEIPSWDTKTAANYRPIMAAVD